MNPGAAEIIINGTRIYESPDLDIYIYNDCVVEMIFTSYYEDLPMTYNVYREGNPRFNELMEKYT